MINRRIFLKGLLGTGAGLHPLMNSKTSAETYQSPKYAAEYYYPELSLLVKVDEVIDHPETRESDVNGICFIGGYVWPVRAYYAWGLDRTEKPTGIQIGNIYVMVGPFFMFPPYKNIDLIGNPTYTSIESALSAQEIQKIESDFARIGLFENRTTGGEPFSPEEWPQAIEIP